MNKFLLNGVALGLIFLASCHKDQIENDPGIFVVKDSNESGLDFSNDLKEGEDLNIVEYLYYYNGGGVGIGDINGDGLEDIYFTGNETSDKLYLNKGNLKFEDVTASSGIIDKGGWSSGVTMDDVDGDGYLDIYVCKSSLLNPDAGYHNLLFINDGTGHFNERSAEFGLNFSGYSTQSCFLDYDKDGDLDMYLLNHAVHSVRSYGNIGKRNENDPVSGDRFFENRINEGAGFVDVTEQAGIYNSPLGYGLAISVGDLNNDGWTDIYIGNDFHENDYYYINNKDKSFSESVASAFTNTSQFSMGVDIADMNNDGLNDVFSTDMMPYDAGVVLKSGGEDTDQVKRIKNDLGFEMQNARNHFQVNDGDGTFTDVAFHTGTYATDWSWSVLLQDFNNDMQNDIFITNGIVKRPNDLDYINYLNANAGGATSKQLREQMPSQPLRNLLFVNKGDLIFGSLEEAFIGSPSFSNGAAYADLDQDGDLDIVTNNINEKAFLLENTSSESSNYLAVRLRGSNALKIVKGSKVFLYAGGLKLVKELQTTRGYQSSSTHLLHFGLRDIKDIDSLIIHWPDGMKQKMTGVKKNALITVDYQPDSEMVDIEPLSAFSGTSPLVLPFKHEENNYFDENMEKLIPERLSYEGPALLCEDLNGDGITDVYIGGARNQKATLLFGTRSGSFENVSNTSFEQDAKYEDIDAATIDFDGDGDKDIYVISGGNDNKELDKILEDRLYLNNGNGDFRRIPISLPHTNGSCISVADFDGDGYEDMFVGASTIPGSYGLSPYSFVLKNLQGQAVDIAYKRRYGMVKDGEWVDYDSDGDPDLVICGDWMNIRVFRNDDGELVEATRDLNLDNTRGFWNTLEFTDLNGDGKLDFLAGNAGTNQKWYANDSIPIKLYVADFDGNGSSDPIIFYSYFNRYLPFASLDKLTSQLPVLKKKFTSYDSYAGVADITDLFEDAQDKIVEYKVINELRSMIFIQQDDGFMAIPLGHQEQLSTINDFEAGANGVIYYLGNNLENVAELGAATSNSGRVLSGYSEEKQSFDTSRKLPLPNGISGRRLKFISNSKLIVVTNNDYPYIINIPEEEEL